MNISKAEFLSALLDDEAGDFERRRMLDELKKDDGLAQTLGRYALMGDVMRAPQGQASTRGGSLLSRIQAELEAEPVYHESAANVVKLPVAPRAVRSYRALGMGMVAAVAAVAVGGFLLIHQHGGDAGAQQASAENSAQMLASLPDAATDARIRQVGRIDPQTRDILKQYVSQHAKYASTTTIASSIRAVSYANER